MNRQFVAALFRRISFVLPGLVALTLIGPAHAGTPAVALTWSLSQFDFGSVPVGQADSETFTLSNTGGRSSGELIISLSGSPAFRITDDGCTGKALGPDKSCSVTVTYAPTTTTGDTGTLAAAGVRDSASMSLFGNSTPNLVLDPGMLRGTSNGTKFYSYDFGPVSGGTSVTQTFTVSNTGTGTTERLFLQGCCASQFTLSNNTCSSVNLAPNGSCTFDLTFTAPAGCSSSATVVTPIDVSESNPFTLYIHLDAFGRCQ